MAKKRLMVMPVLILAFGLVLAGCTIDAATDDAALNGSWVFGEGSEQTELKLDNGAFELSYSGAPIQKGTYTANGGTIAIKITHIHGSIFGDEAEQMGLTAQWYSEAEWKAALVRPDTMTEAEFNEYYGMTFGEVTGTYVVSGNKLTLTLEGEAQVYTKKQSGYTPEPPTDDAVLNGTWVGSGGSSQTELKLDNGAIEMSVAGSPTQKGTYTANGGTITIKVTHFHGAYFGAAAAQMGLTAQWYSEAELKAALVGPNKMTEADFNQSFGMAFTGVPGTYVVSGDTLTLTIMGDTQVLTKKQSGYTPEPSGADAALNGTWVGTGESSGNELKLDNGAIEVSYSGAPMQKGTYTANGGNLIIKITHIHGNFFGTDAASMGLTAQWYSQAELKAALVGPNTMTEAEFNEEYGMTFGEVTGTYVVSGNKLTLTLEGDTHVFTKKQ